MPGDIKKHGGVSSRHGGLDVRAEIRGENQVTPLCLLANMYLELALVFVMMGRDPWRESGDPPVSVD